MRVNNFAAAKTQLPNENEVSSKTAKAGKQFSADLIKRQDEQSVDVLNKLLELITNQGVKLGQVPTYNELKTYRELVGNFIGEAVARMYQLQSQGGWDRHGRHKTYTIIKEVDKLLAEITEDVRKGQSRQMEIMAKQDAIRGLLVDLYM